MQLSNSQTYFNLARAYAGECQAHARYKFVEYGARMQGYNCLAEVIDKVVFNEFNHARMFYTFIQKSSKEQIDNIEIKSGTPFREKWELVENLKLISQDESDEVKLYKSFSKIAEKEGFQEIAKLFTNISSIEATHQKLFTELYNQMYTNTMYKSDKKTKWVCSGCGYEETDFEAFDVCPVCLAKQGFVKLKIKTTNI